MNTEYDYTIDVRNDTELARTLRINLEANDHRQSNFQLVGGVLVVSVVVSLIAMLLIRTKRSQSRFTVIAILTIPMIIIAYLVGVIGGTYLHNRTGCHKILVELQTTDYGYGAVCKSLAGDKAVYIGQHLLN